MKSIFATLSLGLATALAFPSSDEPLLPFIPQHNVEYHKSLGSVDLSHLRGTGPRPIFATEVEETGAEWLRVYFEETTLPADSTIVITSRLDGYKQTLDAKSLAEWSYSTAYFNGDAVSVELFGEPGPFTTSLAIKSVDVGDPFVQTEAICDGFDKRTPSTDRRSARLMPMGCTAWLIDDSEGCYLTAGHCGVSSSSVTQFNVPMSNEDGTVVHPPPQDQYAAEGASIQQRYVTIGEDYAYFGTYDNSETGRQARDVQGSSYILADSAPAANGQTLVITGFGTDSRPTYNQAQKTDEGEYWNMYSTTIQHRVDTTGGNSGSAVEDAASGKAIGIHTHGGCNSSPSSYNSATAIHNPTLQGYLASPKGRCAAKN
eukprot:Rmarinus@m.9573